MNMPIVPKKWRAVASSSAMSERSSRLGASACTAPETTVRAETAIKPRRMSESDTQAAFSTK
jgi:hypothetical protein